MAPISTTTLIVPQIKTIHKKPYEAISPLKNSSLSQAGRTVLLTGAGTGIGFEIAKSYIAASAARLVVIGRRKDVLDQAADQFIAHAKTIGSPTEIIARPVDASDSHAVAGLFGELQARGVFIDVLVLNHAISGPVKPIVDLTLEEEWNIFEINVKSVIDFTQRFWRQPGDKKKVR